jgi:hypothetical protein
VLVYTAQVGVLLTYPDPYFQVVKLSQWPFEQATKLKNVKVVHEVQEVQIKEEEVGDPSMRR